jgi:hypothetical protein
LRVRVVDVPMARPLQTSSGTVGTAPPALIDPVSEEGITGCADLLCDTPLMLKPVVQLIGELSPRIAGDVVAPLPLERKLQQRLPGRRLRVQSKVVRDLLDHRPPGHRGPDVRQAQTVLRTLCVRARPRVWPR